jgi:predicted Kef-type K+ transport protein
VTGFLFRGLFVKETSEGLMSYTILLILIISVPVLLLLFCLGLGIDGLKKYLAEYSFAAPAGADENGFTQ